MPISEDKLQLVDQILNEDPRRQQLELNIGRASMQDPDAYAKHLKMAEENRLPVDTVAAHVPEIESRQRVKAADLDALLQHAPKTSDFLTDPHNATLSIDDLENLRATEEAASRSWYEISAEKFQGMGGQIAEAFKQGLKGAGLSITDLMLENRRIMAESFAGAREKPELPADMIDRLRGGLDIMGGVEKITAKQQELLQSLEAGQKRVEQLTPEDMTLLEEGIRGGLVSIAQQAPGFLVSIVTKSSAPMLGLMTGQVGLESYGNARVAGKSPLEALAYGSEQAAIEFITEKLPADFLMDMMKTGGLKKEAGKFIISELGGEQLATFGQTVSDYFHGLDEQLDAATSVGEMADIQLRRQAVTLIAAAVGSGGQIGLLKTVDAGLNAINRKRAEETDSTVKSLGEQVALDEMISLSEESRLNQRSKDRYEQFINGISDDRKVYIPADIAEQIPNAPDYVSAQIDGTGADVEIPLAKFLTEMVSDPDIMGIVRPYVRASQDGKSLTDLEAGESSAVRRLVERADKAASVRTEADAIFEQVKDQIVMTGRQSEQTARLSAQLIPAYVTVKAEQYGITPREVYQAMGLRIEGPGAAAAREGATIVDQDGVQYDQATGQARTDTPEFRAWFGDSKVVDDSGAPLVVYHGTAADFDIFGGEPKPYPRGYFFSDRGDGTPSAMGGGQVMPTYLSLKNPMALPSDDVGVPAKENEAIARAQRLGHDGLVGTTPAGETIYIAFNPTQIKSVFNRGTWDPNDPRILEQSAEAARQEDRTWAGWEPEVTSAGKIKGAPEWVKDQADLKRMYREIGKYLREGIVGRYWYEDSARAVLDITQGDVVEAEKFIQLLAIYSPQATVGANTTFAIRAWNHYKAGLPAEQLKVKTAKQDDKAIGVLYRNEPFDGRKTSSFYLNLMHEIVDQDGALEQLQLDQDIVEAINKPVTVDMWMYRAFGHEVDASGDDKGAGRYSFTENATRRLTARLNQRLQPGEPRWTPHQVQAAIWSAMKARFETSSVKEKTWRESIKAGYATVDETGKAQAPTTAAARRAHMKIWRKNAVALNSAQATEAANRASASFATFITRSTQVITWEAIPSTTLRADINNASTQAQQLFTAAARDLLVDDGVDLLAQKLGVPTAYIRSGEGAYEGAVSPNNLSHLVPTKGQGDLPTDTVRAYARAIQFITKQDAVPWFRPDPLVMAGKARIDEQRFRVINTATNKVVPGSKVDTLSEAKAIAAKKGEGYEVRGGKLAQGVAVTFDHALTQDEKIALEEMVGGFTMVAPDVALVINYRDDQTKVPFTADEEFLSAFDNARADLSVMGMLNASPLWVEGEYGHVQDWNADPNGNTLLDDPAFANRPDLQEWLLDRRQAFEQLVDEFSGDRLKAIESDAKTLFQAPRQVTSDSALHQAGAVRADGLVPLTHLSTTAGLTTLSPAFHNTGAAGRERGRNGPNYLPRTYFYLAGSPIEPVVAGQARARYFTTVRPEELYDLAGDPDGIKQQVLDAEAAKPVYQKYPGMRPTLDINEVEQAIKKAGYRGYWTNGAIKAAAIFDDIAVEPMTGKGNVAGWDATGAQQDPTQTDEAVVLNQSAYHGSPHQFERFTTEAIGTGEGAQAYGWGLYFAGNRSVAEWYRDKLAGGVEYTGNMVTPEGVMSWEDAVTKYLPKEQADAAIKVGNAAGKRHDMRFFYRVLQDDIIPEIRAALDLSKDEWSQFHMEEEGKGRLYEVELAPKEDEWLLWDKPLSEQSEKVRDIIEPTLSQSFIGRRPTIEIPGSWRGAKMYEWFAGQLGQQQASQYLHSLGIRGIKYLDGTSRNAAKTWQYIGDNTELAAAIDKVNQDHANDPAHKAPDSIGKLGFLLDPQMKDLAKAAHEAGELVLDEGDYNYVVFSEEDVSITRYEQEARAQITLTDSERIIQLGKASDLSSFLHETGHLFLEMEKHFAKQYGVSEDQQKLLEWMGVESFDQVTVDHHEKFAETFEAYLREGKAPSLGLREAFAAFKRWLVRIYQHLRQLPNADLNPEIAQIMDRMLATQAEIEKAMGDEVFDEFFRSKEQAGMTDAEWKKYQERVAKVKDKAQMTVDEAVLAEWRKRKTEEWRDEKTPLVEEERARLVKEPVYAVLNDSIEYPMDYDQLKAALGVDKLPGRLIGKAKKDGVDPAEYAEVYGFPSVKAMVEAIQAAPTLKEAADAAAEARMVEKYGDILNDGSLEQEVLEALHSEERAGLLLDEIRAMKKKAGDKREINREFLKAEAKRLIQGMRFKEIQPHKYYRAEMRAAQKAVTADNEQEKLRAKIQQLTNHYLYKEAIETKEAMQRQRRYAQRVQSKDYPKNQVHPEYAQNMKTLTNMYDLKSQADKIQALDSILNWYLTQTNDENQFVDIALLDEHLVLALEAKKRGELASFRLPAFDDLTAEQVRGLYDMLRHLRYVGGRMADEAKAEVAAKRMELHESIIAEGGKDFRGQRGVVRRGDVQKRKFSHMLNKIPSLRNLIRKLDGFKEDGPAARLIYRLIEEGNSNKLALNKEMFERYETQLEGIHRVGLNHTDMDTYTLQSGLTLELHPEARFMMALYWGTETSRQAIRDGFGVTDSDMAAILSDMTEEQLDLVNATWAVNETLWPDLSAASVRLYGVAPPKLEATPFTVNGKVMTGGHMRLFYDSTQLELKSEQEQAGKLSTVMPTKAGSLHARVGSGGRPPRLDKNNIIRSINENVHFIAFAEIGDQLRSIINANEVKDAIERKHGEGFYRALIETIDSITSARTERESIPWLAGMMRLFRRATTFKHLAYSLRNVVQQFTAIPVAMEEVGMVNWVGALVRFGAPNNHKDFVSFVNQRSKFMENRASLVNREAAEYLSKITVDGQMANAYRTFAAYGFTPQTIVDSMIAYPVWMAKYEQAMMEHGDDKRAVSDADTAVAESVGSGSDLHLGGVFQSTNSEFVRTFTLFGTWFNAYFQRIYKTTKGGTDILNVDAARALITTPFIVAVLSALVIMDEPDDDEEWWAWALKRYGVFMAGTLPLIRDVSSAFAGYSPKTVFAGGAEAPARFWSEMKSLIEGRQTPLKATSDLIKVGTSIAPVPGVGNLTRLLDYTDSYNQGKEGTEWSTYQALVEGSNK